MIKMRLYHDIEDNKDYNQYIYPNINEEHLEYHKIDEQDLKRLDKFYKMICEIIDDCDCMLILSYEDEQLINKYKKQLKYKCYNYIEGFSVGSIADYYIFDISDSKSKEYLKNNIDFNIYHFDDEQAEMYPEIDRKYIHKDTDKKIGDIRFIKCNKLMYMFDRFLGRIICLESFKNRKYKNILKENIIANQDNVKKNILFTYSEIINNNLKLNNYLAKIFEEIDLDNLIIRKYDGESLKSRDNYGYHNLYINEKLIDKDVFKLYFSNELNEYSSKIYEDILENIKSNKNNTYYFNKFYRLKEFLCVALYLKDGKIEEVRNEDAIKQFTKKK